MEPGGSMPHSQGLSIIHILSRINPIPRIDTYLFKVHSNIVLSSRPRPPQRSLWYSTNTFLWIEVLKLTLICNFFLWRHRYTWILSWIITPLRISFPICEIKHLDIYIILGHFFIFLFANNIKKYVVLSILILHYNMYYFHFTLQELS